MFGPPGSGKGTQAKYLKDSLGIAHISTGDMLRDRLAHEEGLSEKVAALMRAGGLVPDEAVNEMVAERTTQPDCDDGFILDGYPRTVPQAKLLLRMLPRLEVTPVVIHLEVDYDVIIKRLSSRRQCPVCGALYGAEANAPRVPGICGLDGTRLEGREDDRPDVIRDRLEAYEKKTAPVLSILREAGYPCFDIRGGDAPERIAAGIEGLVEAELSKAA